MRLLPTAFVIATLFGICTYSQADSVLVGSDLANPTFTGAALCPIVASCSEEAQQFSLNQTTYVTDVKILLSAPSFIEPFGGDSYFSLSLTNGLPGGSENLLIGSGDVIKGVDGVPQNELFDFENIDVKLNSGTYYLVLVGGSLATPGNLDWNYALPINTQGGSIGPEWFCDPTVNCGPNSWQSFNFEGYSHTFEVDGSVVPEPSSYVLLGTGILTLFAVLRRMVYLDSR